jgi:aminopeptidase N
MINAYLRTSQLLKMKRILFFTMFLLFLITVNAQLRTTNFIEDAAAVPRDHPLDFSKIQVSLAFDAPKGLVIGKVDYQFTSLRPKVASFFLDAIKMSVKEVILNGQPVKYNVDNAGITITPNNPLEWNTNYTMSISYEATPRVGLYFIGWNDKNNLSRKQIWSQGEQIDNRNWIPMYDERNDKLLTEMSVTFDKAYKVLSNGQLVNTQANKDGTITWNYAISHPHSPYLIMLGIGKYDIKETHSASGVPMHLYYYPEWNERVEPVYQYSEAMVDFFEKEIGVKYPWESYSQIPVQDYMFGAMENTTATIYGDFYAVDQRGLIDRNYVAVNAHELAHQWFGDCVTALSDAHQWLQESFATYYNQMFEREVFGEDYFNWSRRGAQNASIDESLRNKFAVAHSEGGGTRVYGKGAFVLNMLKQVVGGREMYNKAIKHYLEKHAYQNVDTHDLLIAFEETTGMQLDWFWTEWLNRGGEPAFDISYTETVNNIELVVKQTQALTEVTGYKNGLYKMPIWIEVYYKDGTSLKKQYNIQEQTEIINLNSPNKVDFILFDPANVVMKSCNFEKPFEMLASQASKAEHMLDRYDAIVAMRGIALDTKRTVLQKAFNAEKFFAIRTEVVAQLANDSQSIQLIKDALVDKDVAVRKAALRNVNPVTAGLVPEFEKLLSDSSYDVIEGTLQKLSALNSTKTATYLSLTKNVEGNLGKHVKVRWLETSYMFTSKKQFADELVGLTSGSYEFRTRGNAFAALKRMAYFNDHLTANLLDGLMSANPRLSGPSNELLKFFYSQNQYKNSINQFIAAQKWTDLQKTILKSNGYL